MSPRAGPGHPARSGRRRAVGAVLLFLVALAPRLAQLPELSYYADEDLTALAATSLAGGEGSVLPSGMEYRRGWPYTAMTALSLRWFGGDETALRLPAAILGALTVPALFLMLFGILGGGPATVAALLLALSEWHLVFSRVARMYGPAVLFMVVGTWGMWVWVRTGRKSAFLAGALGALAAMSLHLLGVLCVAVPVAWLAFPSAVAVSPWAVLVAAGMLAALGMGFDALWVAIPYGGFPIPGPSGAATAEAAGSSVLPLVLAGVGAVLAIWWFRAVRPVLAGPERGPLRTIGLFGLAVAGGALAGLGQVYGVALFAALFLLAAGTDVGQFRSRGRVALGGLAALLGAGVLASIVRAGLEEGLKASTSLPYRHAYSLFLQEPVLCLAFAATALAVVVRSGGPGRRPVAVFAILTIGVLALLGFARTGAPTRYLFPAYPWMLTVVGAGLFEATRWLVVRFRPSRGDGTRAYRFAAILAPAIAVSGIVSGHGIPAVIDAVGLEHGEPVDERAHMFPFRPDHRTPGRFVRDAREEGDVVIAEDASAQSFYAGRVDYWFRRYGDMRRFLREYPRGVRDIYAGSHPLADPATVDSILGAATGRVWLITSGETAPLRSYYLSAEQRRWLDSLENARSPAVIGEDGVTSVYCLNCPLDDSGGSSAGGAYGRGVASVGGTIAFRAGRLAPDPRSRPSGCGAWSRRRDPYPRRGRPAPRRTSPRSR